MYYLETGYDKHNRMRNALLLALFAHAALILSVSFDFNSANRDTPQIEVTLATRPDTLAPEDARHISQANQAGSGNEADITQVTTRDQNVAANAPTTQQSRSNQAHSKTVLQQDILSTSAIAQRAVSTDQAEPERQEINLEGISPEVDRINQEMASLQAVLDEQTQAYVNRPRVRRLTSASARQAADAAYLLDWRQRLEAVGNQYYPEASVRYGIYGDLRLLVIIRHDGSLEDIRLLSSSGYAVLDEAAMKIVRMAAPYSPFPAELRATTDKLEIIRTWQFRENRLSSE